MTEPLLTVHDLRVAYPSREGGMTEVVRGVSFTLGRERLGIVGESGSGKSQTGRAILGLTAPGGRVSAQTLQFSGIDLLRCAQSQRRHLEQGRFVHFTAFGSSASRSPSPSRLKARLTMKMAAPGAAATHHWSST